MKRFFGFMLALTFIFSSSLNAFGQYAILSQGGYAKVLRIIDGDALEVSFIQDNSTALVRMIGVDAQGYNDAVTYLNNELAGRIVRLSLDQNIPSPQGRWNMMYVFSNEVLINRALLERGYAKINETHRYATLFENLSAGGQSGENKQIGLWSQDTKNVSKTYAYSADCVNINTATASQLQDWLVGVNNTLARRIVSYRSENPFNSIREIKFVNGFSKEIFDDNRELMTVSTNIKRASERELRTLKNLTQTDVNNIMDYREEHTISNVKELYQEEIISQSKFNANESFVSVRDVEGIEYAVPDIVVNANTASGGALVLAGLSESAANRIIDYREYHPFRSFGEIAELLDFSDSAYDELEDNIKTVTDSNYGKNDSAEEYINLNTATYQQFRDLGLSVNEANKMVDKHKGMYTFKQIPVSSSLIKEKGVLFTNINRTTAGELATLDRDMTSDLINDILRYVEDQPFGSMSEVRDFFSGKDRLSLYNSIREFVVLR